MRGWRWLVLLAWLCWSGVAGAAVQELQVAQARVQAGGVDEQLAVALPYHWDSLHPGQSGQGVFEIPWSLPERPREPHGMYFAQLGNAYEVWLNGTLLQRNGLATEPNGLNYAKAPRYLLISPQLIQPDNLIRIEIRADTGRRAGVPAVVVGPDEEVRPIYAREYRWRVGASLAVLMVSVLVGMGALALWATQAGSTGPAGMGRDPVYLLAALAELFWALRMSDFLVERPPLDWPWWGVLMTLATPAWGGCMAVFCVEISPWRSRPWVPWLKRWLVLLWIAGGVSALAAFQWGYPGVLAAWEAVLGLSFFVVATSFVLMTRTSAPMAQRLMSAVLLLNTVVAIRDGYVLRVTNVYGADSYLRYSAVLFGLVLGYIVLQRFRWVTAQARDLMQHLAERVRQREEELQGSYAELERLAREQERLAERSRILRDMHDGVGSHISAAIRQLQSGRASQEEVLQTLRDSLDQLKLSMDAMHLPPGDVGALLANLRYRLAQRFGAAGLTLDWAVEALPVLPALDAQAMRHLQFMVFEALSNVLQHARATALRIEAVPDGTGVRLRLEDNGAGFDVAQPPRNGLRSMQERAAAIGARLQVTSKPGRTVVEIGLG